MKKLFLLFSFIFFINNLFSHTINQLNILSKDQKLENSKYSIVFVHLGSELPTYLPIAAEQARLFNKEAKIYIIANEGALLNVPETLINSDIIFVKCESLNISDYHNTLIKTSILDRKFWHKAVERFFYLDDFINQYNLTNVFHLENDVMLYKNLSDYLKIFSEKYRGMIASTFDSDDRCIPGFVYIDNKFPLSELCKFLTQEAKSYGSDMSYIGSFMKKYHGKYIDYLPIMIKSYVDENELKNLLGNKTDNKYFYCTNFEKFNSIFDAAAIGQYLGGTINHGHPSGFINERCLFNCSNFSFEWHLDSENRLVPYIVYKNEKYPINNLHIHCKDLKAFYSIK